MTENEKAKEIMLEAVFLVFCQAECSSYTCAYAPELVVVSAKEVANVLKWTVYRARKAIRELVSVDGLKEHLADVRRWFLMENIRNLFTMPCHLRMAMQSRLRVTRRITGKQHTRNGATAWQSG